MEDNTCSLKINGVVLEDIYCETTIAQEFCTTSSLRWDWEYTVSGLVTLCLHEVQVMGSETLGY